jgi:DNA topoisomerase IB
MSASNSKRQKLNDENFKDIKPVNMDNDTDADNSDEDANSKTKWKTLEHHGMTFPEAYKPLPSDVKVKYKASGKPIDLPLEIEEIACWWSSAEGTEFGEKEKSKENFWLDFKNMLDKVSIGAIILIIICRENTIL